MQTVHHNRLKPCTSNNGSRDLSGAMVNSKQNETQQAENQPEPSDEPLIGIIPNDNSGSETNRARPTRNRRPPDRYGDTVYDYDTPIP